MKIKWTFWHQDAPVASGTVASWAEHDALQAAIRACDPGSEQLAAVTVFGVL